MKKVVCFFALLTACGMAGTEGLSSSGQSFLIVDAVGAPVEGAIVSNGSRFAKTNPSGFAKLNIASSFSLDNSSQKSISVKRKGFVPVQLPETAALNAVVLPKPGEQQRVFVSDSIVDDSLFESLVALITRNMPEIAKRIEAIQPSEEIESNIIIESTPNSIEPTISTLTPAPAPIQTPNPMPVFRPTPALASIFVPAVTPTPVSTLVPISTITPVATITPIPVSTPTPVSTLVPVSTITPTPVATITPIPVSTLTPAPVVPMTRILVVDLCIASDTIITITSNSMRVDGSVPSPNDDELTASPSWQYHCNILIPPVVPVFSFASALIAPYTPGQILNNFHYTQRPMNVDNTLNFSWSYVYMWSQERPIANGMPESPAGWVQPIGGNRWQVLHDGTRRATIRVMFMFD